MVFKIKHTTSVFVFTCNQEKVTKTADTYAVEVQREEVWVFKGFLMFISG